MNPIYKDGDGCNITEEEFRRSWTTIAPAQAPMTEYDPVNHPSHYTQGGIECIDALTAMVSGYEDPNDAALTWQVGKYIWRHPFKHKPVEDLKKARFYLDRLIGYLEGKD